MAAQLHQLELTVRDPAATARRIAALADRASGPGSVDLGRLRLAFRQGIRTARGPDGLRTTGPAHLCLQGGDIEALAARLAAGGWRAFGAPTGLGGNIRYQYAEDDDGLIVEVESVPGAAADASPWVAHVALATPDRDRLVDWYAALTGTAPRRSARLGPNAQIDQVTGLRDVEVSGAWLPAGAVELEFWTYHTPPTREAAPGPLGALTFVTADVSAEVAHLDGHGFAIDASGAATAHDPDGNAVHLIGSAR